MNFKITTDNRTLEVQVRIFGESWTYMGKILFFIVYGTWLVIDQVKKSRF